MIRLELLFFLGCNFVGLHAQIPADSIGWTSGERWHKFEVRLEPSGVTFGNKLYLCRRAENGDIIPGKLMFKTVANIEQISCDVNYNGDASSGSNYEVAFCDVYTTLFVACVNPTKC